MAILITGGAGYIGSHATKYFLDKGEDVIVCDNLQTGHKASLDTSRVPIFKVDLRDKKKLDTVFKENDIEGVIHFAANSLVGESMEKAPHALKYRSETYFMP